jgi:hypothetical protein
MRLKCSTTPYRDKNHLNQRTDACTQIIIMTEDSVVDATD